MIRKGDTVKVNMPRVKRERYSAIFLRGLEKSRVNGHSRGIVLASPQRNPIQFPHLLDLPTYKTVRVQFKHLVYPLDIDERHLTVLKTGSRHPLTSIFK